MKQVIVQLHAQAADLAGERQVVVGVGAGATPADLKEALAAAHPCLASLLGSSAVATDREYLSEGAPLGSDERFHIVPPVSGG